MSKKITLPKPPEKIIMVAVPVHDGKPTAEFLNSWTSLLAQGEQVFPAGSVKFVLRTLEGESLITRGRNQLVRDFMEAKNEKGEPFFTHLLFIDSDIGFTVNNIKRLLDSGFDVVGGIYPIKMFNWPAVLTEGVPPKTAPVEVLKKLTVSVVNGIGQAGEDGFAECVELGTGFMLITRHVFEKMRREWPDRLPNGTRSWYQTDYRSTAEQVRVDDFFGSFVVDWPDLDPQTGKQLDTTHPRLLSEDYAFCWLWRQLGGKVWVDVGGEILAHRGFFTWGRG